MTDMNNPGPNHPANRGLDKRSESQFGNVLDLSASRAIKARTGQSIPVRSSAPESPAMEKHIESALAIHKAPAQKKSLGSRVSSAYNKTMNYLGMTTE